MAWSACALAMTAVIVPLTLLNGAGPDELSFTIVGVSSVVVGGLIATSVRRQS